MICERCGKNKAEIYYKQTVNGKTVEYALCSHCADSLKKEGKLDMNMPSFFEDSIFGFGGKGLYGLDELFGLPASTPTKRMSEKKKCTLCSSTFDELVKMGRVGCAECYKVFADELKSSIESIHGKAGYVGNACEVESTDDNKKIGKFDRLTELKKELDTAIAAQEFEKAAVLRDEIRALDNKQDSKKEG